VTLTDGRVLVGLLQCVDKQGNLVLHSTREYRPARCGFVRL
jgi:small nuclear ribonucleoprotein (snRNP)-like protein